jgi:hypothetical protein
MPPFGKYPYYLRIIIRELIPKLSVKATDYLVLETLTSSKDLIPECVYNNISVPLLCIKKIETLHEILNQIFIDDVIFLIEQYI